MGHGAASLQDGGRKGQVGLSEHHVSEVGGWTMVCLYMLGPYRSKNYRNCLNNQV
jgi:hypothetical protein